MRSRGAGRRSNPVFVLTEQTYPIQKKHLPEHVLREQAHLRFKTTLTAATMRVRDALMRDWHDWFEVRPAGRRVLVRAARIG